MDTNTNTATITENQKFQLELFKLEYVQAGQRYENIYKAIWQIFSYMAALTAAILTFASRNIPFLYVMIIAPFPLTFWYLAIYLPMDNYGQEIRARLSNIEKNLNTEFATIMGSNVKFNHFLNFNNKMNSSQHNNSNDTSPNFQEYFKKVLSSFYKKTSDKPRVSKRVKCFAIFITLFWIVACIINVINPSNQSASNLTQIEHKFQSPVQLQIQNSQIQDLNKELQILSKKLDNIELLLREKNKPITKDKGVNN
jgi:hypothetical protein